MESSGSSPLRSNSETRYDDEKENQLSVIHMGGRDYATQSPSATIPSLIKLKSTTSPISRLPAEVLSNVFMILGPAQWASSEWHRATHVCQYWRQVALGYPRLWTYINTLWHKQAAEFLRRSGSAPLTVNITFHEKDTYRPFTPLKTDPPIPRQEIAEAVKLTLGQLSRICDLKVHVKTPEQHDTVREFLALPAPRMERLDLSVGSSLLWVKLTPPLFRRECPALTSLSMNGFSIPWDTAILQRMTRLDLQGIHGDDAIRMSDLLVVLESSPGLAILRLDFYASTEDLPPSRTINLPCLRGLVLHMDTRNSAYLLSLLCLPKFLVWYFKCHNYPILDPIAFLPPDIPIVTQFQSFKVHFGELHIVVKAKPSFTSVRRESTAICELEWMEFVEQRVLLETLGINLRPCFSSHIDALQLKWSWADDSIDEAAWSEFFATFPKLRALAYRNYCFPTPTSAGPETALANALTASLQEDHQGAYPCPHLTTLTLEGVNFDPEYSPFFEVFENCLTLRKDHGRPLAHLKIVLCYGITDKVTEVLQSVVDIVSWDGDETDGGPKPIYHRTPDSPIF